MELNVNREPIVLVKNSGMTFAELLIASVLITIVMLSVVIFSTTIKRIQDSTQQGILLTLRTNAAMGHIQRNTAMAIGDHSDPGVILILDGADLRGFSIRQDNDDTPADYSDDDWVIYALPTGLDNTLTTCQQSTGEGSDFCMGTSGDEPWCPDFDGPCSADNRLVLSEEVTTFGATLVEDNAIAEADFYMLVDLQTMFDPTGTYNPLTNPTYSLKTKIAFPSHGSSLP